MVAEVLYEFLFMIALVVNPELQQGVEIRRREVAEIETKEERGKETTSAGEETIGDKGKVADLTFSFRGSSQDM